MNQEIQQEFGALGILQWGVQVVGAQATLKQIWWR